MPKTAISVTLDRDNLLWLRGQAASGTGNLSETLDALVAEARLAGRGSGASVRSVVGTVDIAADDPDLARADDAIRSQYERSLSRPVVRRERPISERRQARRPHGKARRG